MTPTIIITIGLLILAFISGMVGLGVAFAAIPFISFFLPDLVNQVHPLSLLLNGITALFAVLGFAKSGYVEWKKAIVLALITTITAPLGAYLAHLISQLYIWIIYFVSVSYLAYRLFKPVQQERGTDFNTEWTFRRRTWISFNANAYSCWIRCKESRRNKCFCGMSTIVLSDHSASINCSI